MKMMSPFVALALSTATSAAAAQDNQPMGRDDFAQWVTDWAEAWQSQDLAGYFNRYHSDFVPQLHDSRDSWLQERTDRISAPASIEIAVCDVEVIDTAETGTTIRFWMDYRSAVYADSTRKEMLIGRDDDSSWRILREINLELQRRTTADDFAACAVPVVTAVVAGPQQAAAVAAASAAAPNTQAPVAAAATSPAASTTAAVQAPAAAAAHDEKSPFYAGVHAGTHDVDKWNGQVELGKGIAFDGQVGLDSKWAAGLVVGREYEHTRLELEYQQGRYDVTDIALGIQRADVSGAGKYQALTANAYGFARLYKRLDGYAAVGIGWGKATLPQLGFAGGCQCFAAADESGFVWQWRLGLEYRVSEANSVFLQYTGLMDLPGPVSAAGSPSVRYEDKDAASVTFGWRFRFK
jgi:opacity protein-like surface antigen